MRKRLVTIALATTLGLIALHGVASADTDFGTGNSSKGPQDAGSVCSPSPTLDASLSQCK